MNATAKIVNPESGKTAPLRNVALFHELVVRLKDRPRHLPGWGVFYAVSGLGKTTAAMRGAIATHSLYLECGSTWTTGSIVDALMHELSIPPFKGSVAKRVNKIIETLADDPVPLIFDEADHLVKKSLVDVVREISDKSSAPVILIGEQHLPSKLQEFERAHNRVLEWVQAEPCNLKDAKELAKLYAGKVEIAEDLLQRIVTDTDGSTRRIVTNIDRVRDFAVRQGLMIITNKDFPEVIYRGLPPQRLRINKGAQA
jgi:DNA transposition AAA+ family ATPase